MLDLFCRRVAGGLIPCPRLLRRQQRPEDHRADPVAVAASFNARRSVTSPLHCRPGRKLAAWRFSCSNGCLRTSSSLISRYRAPALRIRLRRPFDFRGEALGNNVATPRNVFVNSLADDVAGLRGKLERRRGADWPLRIVRSQRMRCASARTAMQRAAVRPRRSE